MAKELSYEELLALALKHYRDGGDGVYECWDKPMYDLYVSENWKIADDMRVYNAKTGKSIGIATVKRNRWRYEV